MYVVIFRARIRSLDEEYSRVAARMRSLAIERYGCLDFRAVGESYSVQVAAVTRQYRDRA